MKKSLKQFSLTIKNSHLLVHSFQLHCNKFRVATREKIIEAISKDFAEYRDNTINFDSSGDDM